MRRTVLSGVAALLMVAVTASTALADSCANVSRAAPSGWTPATTYSAPLGRKRRAGCPVGGNPGDTPPPPPRQGRLGAAPHLVCGVPRRRALPAVLGKDHPRYAGLHPAWSARSERQLHQPQDGVSAWL